MNKEIIIKNEIAELERVAVFVKEVSQLLSLDS